MVGKCVHYRRKQVMARGNEVLAIVSAQNGVSSPKLLRGFSALSYKMTVMSPRHSDLFNLMTQVDDLISAAPYT